MAAAIQGQTQKIKNDSIEFEQSSEWKTERKKGFAWPFEVNWEKVSQFNILSKTLLDSRRPSKIEVVLRGLFA